MNVHVLPDRARTDARSNLDALIERARGLQVFGPTVDFDAAVWDLSAVKDRRLSTAAVQKLYFTTHAARHIKGLDGRIPLAKGFGDLIKSLIVLRECARPQNVANHLTLLFAARSLHETLKNRGFDPIELVSSDFAAACNAIRDAANAKRATHVGTTMYRRGQAIEAIAQAVNRHNIAKARIVFTNPFPRVAFDDTRLDAESKAQRASKMASEEVIDAIIAMSKAVRHDRKGDDADLLLAAVVELLLCAPWRINELLDLALDCVRTESPPTGRTGRRFGIIYNGSKGAPDSVKWIPSAMTEIAERALEDIRRVTKPARDIAIWMEQHPGRVWMPEPWRLADPDTLVSMRDLAGLLNMHNNCTAHQWATANHIELFLNERKRKLFCRLGDVENALLTLQPAVGKKDTPLSKRLILAPRHFLAQNKNTNWSVITCVCDAQVRRFLCGHLNMKSIFERLDIRVEAGAPYRVNTHALRHYLNTLAQEGMLSQLDIARWSGRKDVRENATYDHTGGRHLAEKMREALQTGAMRGPVVDTVDALPPVERESFLKARFATAHTTDIGMCVQDWSLAPCPSYGGCAGCGEHMIVKGDERHRERSKQLLVEHEAMLSHAKQEMSEGTFGAGPWVEHNERMVAGLKKALAVHADVDVAQGALVQLR